MDWDANSKFELLLYKTVNQGEPSTATGAVQIGGTINAGTLNNVAVAAHTWTGLDYGYYVDTNTTSTLEDCYTEWYGFVQAEVCDDVSNIDYTTVPTDPVLRLYNPQLCSLVLDCCTLDTIAIHSIRGTTCAPILYSSINCDPFRTVQVEWFYSTNGSSYSSLGVYSLGYINSSTSLFANAGNDPVNGANWFTQTGFYKAVATCEYNGATVDICIVEDSQLMTFPTTGCMDAAAYNYNSLAVCPGPCAFPSWDCDAATGNCYDPWTGTFNNYTPGPYNCLNGVGCCNSYCTPPITYGCTDPCATNYDATVTNDDGSCTYTACLSNTATNQYQNCCNQNYYPASSIIGPDPSCCIEPCGNPHTISIATTDSTSTCTVFNNDGTVNITVTINNSAPTWTWEIWDASNTSIIYTDTTVYSGSTTSSTYSLLGSGNYNVKITDSFGCWQIEPFTIGSTSPQVGCTDPDADNYDPNAICDCCCQVAGCLDPNASNYITNANTLGECEYDLPPPSPCIPTSLEKDKKNLKTCLSLKGTKWLNDYKIGRADDCTVMNKWKLILIDYLLEQDGLSCLYNCADIQTPDVTIAQDCNDLWVTGGASTGLNHDSNHIGASIINAGEGTTVTTYDGFPTGWFGYVSGNSPTSNTTYTGDVIKFDLPTGHPLASWLNGTIWTLALAGIPQTGYPNNGGIHQGCHHKRIQHYTQCLDMNTISITSNINYYDNFFNFVNKFCQDCNISIL